MEKVIIKEIEKVFFPFKSEEDLIEKVEKFNLKRIKTSKGNSWKVITYIAEQKNKFISGMTIGFSDKDLFLAVNIGELEFPRIFLLSSKEELIKPLQPAIEELYGNGFNNLYKYTRTNEVFEFPIRKNKLYFFLHKSIKRKIGNFKNKYKGRVFLSAINDFIANQNKLLLSELSEKRLNLLSEKIIKEILFKAFFLSVELKNIQILEMALEQRSSFIGLYLYPILMNTVRYNEEEWEVFIQKYILPNFKISSLNILKSLKEDIDNNRIVEADQKYLKAALQNRFSRENTYLRTNMYFAIEKTEMIINHYGDRLFSKDNYITRSKEDIEEEYFSIIEKYSFDSVVGRRTEETPQLNTPELEEIPF